MVEWVCQSAQFKRVLVYHINLTATFTMKQNQESANLIPTNQSILVSGESGAGKTVTTKIVLNYFAMLSKQVRLFIDTESALFSMHWFS